MTDLNDSTVSSFRGRIERASYREAELKMYRGNPLIEALPPIWSEEEFLNLAAYLPACDPEERGLASQVRLHALLHAAEFYEPLGPTVELEQRVSRIIRTGYKSRNPLHHEFWTNIDRNVETFNSEVFKQYVHSTRSSVLSFILLGLSGMGKTTSLKTVLSLYPQVIVHKEYRGQKFSRRQLVWLMLQCPHNRSVRQLCLDFLQTVDAILQTDYYSDFGGNGRAPEHLLIGAVARIASIHSIGVLVLDELQNLSVAKSGGEEKMLNFFVGLTNTIGIPVIMVGTPKARVLVSNAFRAVRRGAGQGDFVWDRLKNDDTWQFFLESLWRYQYTRIPAPLTEELSQQLYYETQGIIDLAVKVYILAQIRAITTGMEVINKHTFHSVAIDRLQTAQEMLDALRSGNLDALRNYEDIAPINLRKHVEEAIKELNEKRFKKLRQRAAASLEGDTQSEPETQEPAATEELDQPQPENQAAKKPAQRTRKKGGQQQQYASDSLITLFKNATEQNSTVYKALHDGGHIKPALELWSSTVAP